MSDSWQALSPLLHNHGYCVLALNYGAHAGSGAVGVYAIGDIAESAAQLSSFIDQVLAATGAEKVDLAGHSQGGMMPTTSSTSVEAPRSTPWSAWRRRTTAPPP